MERPINILTMNDFTFPFGVMDVIDVIAVALLLYYLYRTMKRSGSLNMFIGILVFIILWVIVSLVLKMRLLGAIMDRLVDVGAIAIIVLFADDIRRFFRNIGTGARDRKLLFWLFRRQRPNGSSDYTPIVQASANMSSQKVGALMVFGSADELQDIIGTGETVDARISQRLIENIFFKNTPLHDGAMIIVDGRIEAAACVLPLSDRSDLPKHFGLRHRSAMGVTERTQAVAVVVSEETGAISAFHRGQYVSGLDAAGLDAFLKEHIG